MSTKKYRLLKDLPHIKAGAIYTQENQDRDYFNSSGCMWYQRIHRLNIEEAKEWFELVNEQIEVTYFGEANMVGFGKNNGYGFLTSKPIPEDKLPLIKEAIQNVLNKSEGKPQDWIIESCKMGGIVYSRQGHELNNYYVKDLVDKKQASIHSVKRLSDGEVFSLQDNIYSKATSINSAFEIKSIKLVNDKFIYLDGCPLDNAIKVQPQPISAPTFTLEQLNEERRKAFEAGRERIGGAWNEQIKNWKYPTLEDYKNIIPTT